MALYISELFTTTLIKVYKTSQSRILTSLNPGLRLLFSKSTVCLRVGSNGFPKFGRIIRRFEVYLSFYF